MSGLKPGVENDIFLSEIGSGFMHQSIPPAPSLPSHPPPRADPRALAFFFCLGWQIPGDGDS